MLNGDLSNAVPPRLLIVFEGLLGHLPPELARRHARLARRRRWAAAASLWELDPLAARKIADLTARLSASVEIVTYAGPGDFARALEDRLDDAGLAVRRVTATAPETAARVLAAAPDVAVVVDPDPARAGLYGSKGRPARDLLAL